jgi:hypothetical protein
VTSISRLTTALADRDRIERELGAGEQVSSITNRFTCVVD